MRMALEAKSGSMFKGRELRMKKAVEPRRLEKKANRKEERKSGNDVRVAEQKVQTAERIENQEKEAE